MNKEIKEKIQKFTKTREIEFWGEKYKVSPALSKTIIGDGKSFLWFGMGDTRPHYYIIRVDSKWEKMNNNKLREKIEEEIYEILISEFGICGEECEEKYSQLGDDCCDCKFPTIIDDNRMIDWGFLQL